MFLPLVNELWQSAGLRIGDEIRVVMEPDVPSGAEVSADWLALVALDPAAFFGRLTPFP